MIQTIIAGLLVSVALGPCKHPAGTEVKVAVVPITAYYIVSENDYYTGPRQEVPGIAGKTANAAFLKATKLEGTGRMADGTYITRSAGRFLALEAPAGRYGPLTAGQTAAAHENFFEPGTVVCSPVLGWTVTVTDSGGGLGPEGPLDVFVGDLEAYKEWLATAPKEALVISWKEE
jgi:hypothetical protein